MGEGRIPSGLSITFSGRRRVEGVISTPRDSAFCWGRDIFGGRVISGDQNKSDYNSLDLTKILASDQLINGLKGGGNVPVTLECARSARADSTLAYSLIAAISSVNHLDHVGSVPLHHLPRGPAVHSLPKDSLWHPAAQVQGDESH